MRIKYIHTFLIALLLIAGTVSSQAQSGTEYFSFEQSVQLDTYEGTVSDGFTITPGERGQATIQSLPIRVPLDADRPFLALGMQWDAQLGDPHQISVYVRGSANGTEWGEWIDTEHDHHVTLEDNWKAGNLVFLDKNTRFVQYRATLTPHITFRNPTVENFRLNFINPGITPEHELAAHREKALPAPDSRELRNEIRTRGKEIDFQVNTSEDYPLPTYVDRETWGAPLGLSNLAFRSVTEVSHLIVHHSAGQTNSNDFAAVVRSYYSYHTGPQLGWADIGYNWLVDGNGVIYQGRAFHSNGNTNVIGAHFSGQNSFTMGICVIGNYNVVAPTDEAMGALRRMLAWKANERNIDVLVRRVHPSQSRNIFTISGHRDGGSTDCPGHVLYAMLPEVRTRTHAFLNPPGILAVDHVTSPATPDLAVIETLVETRKSDVIGYVEYGFAANELTFESPEFEISGENDSELVSIELTGLTPGTDYFYRVVAVNSDTLTVSETQTFNAGSGTNVDIDDTLPTDFVLNQNFPNPFNPTTSISFSLPETSNIRILIHNLQGQLVNVAADQQFAAGSHTVRFDASGLSSGIYVYSLELDGRTLQTKKMMFVK